MSGKWFYNGTVMSDGTPISVEARSEAEEKSFRARGYRAVPKRGSVRRRTTVARNRRGKD